MALPITADEVGAGPRAPARAPTRFAARLVQLHVGLIGFGVSLALMVRAELGLGPWDVLHQGLARMLGLPLGVVVIAVGAVVLLGWVALRERPGIGTLSNVVLVGLVVDATLLLLPTVGGLGARLALLVTGIVVNAVATACYIGAGLGAGPRDGLMTGIARRGYAIGRVRTGIEVTVLVLGIVLGGSIGVGTVAYALAVGPLIQVFAPRLQRSTVPTEVRP